MIAGAYPCCGKTARQLPESGRVERRHFCEADDEQGTQYQINVSTVEAAPGVLVHRIEFFDLASPEAVQQYGTKRIPTRRIDSN